MQNNICFLASRILWVLHGVPLVATAGEPITSTPMPTNTMQPLGTGYLVQFGFGLVVVLATVVVLVWLLRRIGQLQTSFGGSLKTLGGLSLGTRERIVLVQVGDTQLLLGVAPGRIQTLYVLDTPLEKASASQESEPRSQFAKRLAIAMRQSLDRQDIKR